MTEGVIVNRTGPLQRLLLFLLLALALPAQARSAVEQARIEHLIKAVATLDQAVFLRNGDRHKAAQAAAHLREKLDYAGERIATAEQFIAECATRSWLSRRNYRIRFRDGREVEAAAFLRQRLAAYDAAARAAR